MRTVITAEKDSLSIYLEKLWMHRSFIVVLAKRDLKIKYAQTLLGLAWTIIQPLVAIVIYTVFFQFLLDFQTPYPYVLFVLSGVTCWNLFNQIFTQTGSSLLHSQDLISKFSFPKLVLPLSKVLVAIAEFCLTLIILLIMLVWYKIPITPYLLLFPIIILSIILVALGSGLMLAASTLRYRDLHYLIPFLLNFGIWLTPVFYPVSLITDSFKNILYLNPIASLLSLLRTCLFGDPLDILSLSGIIFSILFIGIGFFYFKHIEDTIAESI